MNAGYNTMFKMLKAFSSIAKIGNPFISFIQILWNSVLLSSCNQHFVLLTLDLNTDNECRADNTHLKKGGGAQKCPPPWLGDEENFEICKL